MSFPLPVSPITYYSQVLLYCARSLFSLSFFGEGAVSERGGAVAMTGHDSSNSNRGWKQGTTQTQCSSNNLPSGASAYLRNRSRFPGYFRENDLVLWAKYILVELRELSNACECEHDAIPRGYDPVNQ